MHLCPHCEAVWNAEGVRIDPHRRRASWRGGEVQVKGKQARLLAALASTPGRVVARDRIVDALWGDQTDGGPLGAHRVLYEHIRSLRRRLAGAGFPGSIVNHHGVGYELVLIH